jgi:hypothetical protein
MFFENPFHPFTDQEFNDYAVDLFKFQYENNEVYRAFCDGIHTPVENVSSIDMIPFLPISFFKTHQIKTTSFIEEKIFTSSGTTGMEFSQHFVKDLYIYKQAFTASFNHFYGDFSNYTFIALLPNYLERNNSSLIFMMDHFISHSFHSDSGYYLYNHDELFQKLNDLKAKGQKTILFGVTYALLDFIEKYQLDFPELIVFETGGMKGRRKELVKEALHQILKQGFGVNTIHSEYGMCELLSQAYSAGNNLFLAPPWMKMVIRDEKEPIPSQKMQKTYGNQPKTGVINIIDFANIYSCSFIATEDLGRVHEDGSIELLGRLDSAQIRGCNLLVI